VSAALPPTSGSRPARRRPPGRYDEPSRVASRALAVVLGVLFLGLVGAVAWTLFDRYGNPGVRYQVVGYSTGQDRVTVDFEVAAEQGREVTCVVRARNRAGAEVGRELVDIEPLTEQQRSVRVRHELRTTDVPVTGEVQRCVLGGVVP
jgi:hypothetical protein